MINVLLTLSRFPRIPLTRACKSLNFNLEISHSSPQAMLAFNNMFSRYQVFMGT